MGSSVGSSVGAYVGSSVGAYVGILVGAGVKGDRVGMSVGMFVGMGSKHPPFSFVSLGSRSSFSSQLSRSKSSHNRVGVPNFSML